MLSNPFGTVKKGFRGPDVLVAGKFRKNYRTREYHLKKMSYRPRRRRRRFKRYYPRRRRAISGGRNAGRIALRKVQKLERQQEQKEIYAANGTMNLPAGGNTIHEAFGPFCTEGDGIANRDGRKITVKSLMVKVQMKKTVLDALGSTIRLMIVYDRRPEGAEAAVTAMMATANSVLAGYQIQTKYAGRFQFLTDRTIIMDSVEAQWMDSFFVKKDFKVEYNDTDGGTIADVEKGAFLIMAVGTNADIVTVNYSYRFRFTDA